MSGRGSGRRNDSAICDVFFSQDGLAAAAEEPDDLDAVLMKERSVKEEVNHGAAAAADLLLHEDGKMRKSPTGTFRKQR